MTTTTSAAELQTSADIASYFGVVFPLLFVVCVLIVYSFAERGNTFPWHSYITITACYFVSLGIILLVPIDIATVVTERRTSTASTTDVDSTYVANTNRISACYSSFFTMVIVFAQVIMVFEEYYNSDGHFTLLSRLRSSLYFLVRDLLAVLVIGAITLGLLVHFNVMSSNALALQLSAVIVTNTLYEFFLMFLLGYGLIEFPRRYWLDADINGQLLRTQIKAASDFADILEGQVNMSIEYANVIKTAEKLREQLNSASTKKQLADAMEIIISELPAEGFNAIRSGEVACDPKSHEITIESLALLRRRIHMAKNKHRMALAKVEKTKLQAYYLEDLIEAMKRNDPADPIYDGVRKINWSLTATTSTTMGYDYHLRYKPLLTRFVSLIWALLSIFSFIGVVCSYNGVNIVDTPYFQAVHSSDASTGSIVIFIFITFGYTVYITFWSLFQMRLGGLMDLVLGETTAVSLSFNARMIARLAAPLVFFYLGWLAENGIYNGDTPWVYDQAVTNPIQMTSSFANFYQLQQVAFIKRYFGTMFRTILIIFLALVITDFYNILCVKLGANWAQFGIPRVTPEQEREGKRRLVADKKKTLNAARRKRMLVFLMGQRPRTDEDEPMQAGGLFSLLWNPAKALAESEQTDIQSDGPSRVAPPRDITPPSALGGLVEIKVKGRVFGSWKEWWAEVRAPGIIHFYSQRPANSNNVNFIDPLAPPPVELLDVIDFKIESPTLLQLITADAQLTLRFKTAVECDTWQRLLIEWKDFSIDHGREYMARRRDVERGSTSSSASFASSAGVLGSSAAAGAAAVSRANLGSSSSSASPSLLGANSSSSLGEDRPGPVDVFVEMKTNTAGFMSSEWQKRFLRIEERSSSLVVTKTSGASDKPLAVIHLPEAGDIHISAEFGPCYFEVPLDATTYKFRASSESEGARITALLNAWKEYLLLNLTH